MLLDEGGGPRCGGVGEDPDAVDAPGARLGRPRLDGETWKRPLYITGVLDPDDAAKAVELGADGIVVANHGGRQLDGAPATLDALPASVDRVGAEVPVMLDGAIRRGSDVVKALCLGASSVAIGRPHLHGLAARGGAGVEQVLDILREEITRTMTLIGCGSVSELNHSFLVPAGRGW